MLGHVDAEDRVIGLSGVDDLVVLLVKVFFLQVVDLEALDRRNPHVVEAVVDQDLPRVRVDRLLFLF